MASPTTTTPPPNPPRVLELLLDTRPLWPEAKSTADLAIHASRALSLLPAHDRAACLRFVFARDARLAIGSALLKRLAISALLGLRWADAGPVVRDAGVRGGKPRFGGGGVEFNVSHQDGIVVLAAATTTSVAAVSSSMDSGTKDEYDKEGGHVGIEIGVDVVSPRERHTHDTTSIATHGWPHFVTIHSDVLSPVEISRLKAWPPPGRPSGDSSSSSSNSVDDKLRAFYALWCLREAYVKMSGDALLAEWLGELEFRAFRAPVEGLPLPPPLPLAKHEPLSGSKHSQEEHAHVEEKDVVTEKELDIYFKGRKVDTATTKVRLAALEGGYMVCAAVRGAPEGMVEIGMRWAWIGMDEVLDFAESGGGGGGRELRVGQSTP